MHCAIIEAETREEVMEEMEDRIHHLEQNFTRRLMKEVCPRWSLPYAHLNVAS